MKKREKKVIFSPAYLCLPLILFLVCVASTADIHILSAYVYFSHLCFKMLPAHWHSYHTCVCLPLTLCIFRMCCQDDWHIMSPWCIYPSCLCLPLALCFQDVLPGLPTVHTLPTCVFRMLPVLLTSIFCPPMSTSHTVCFKMCSQFCWRLYLITSMLISYLPVFTSHTVCF